MQIKIAVLTAASLATLMVSPAFAVDDPATPTTHTILPRTSPNPSGNHGLRSNVLRVSCAAIETNASNLLAKVQFRITRAQNEGKDVTAALTAVGLAQADLANGKSLCDQAIAKFNSVTDDKWSEQLSTIREARALARQAKESFVKLRHDLGDAVKAIRGLGLPQVSPKPKASPTASPEASPSTAGQQ
ncbi:MAG TPA: hypothetical protein VFG51_01400 [Candidatus Saccharimonadia bacterium]|nr:hypothetical protein [Candidatus Saccharimonadia bacterium]